MLLVEKEKGREHIQFEPIKITSPDQYVPLYVASQTPFSLDGLGWSAKYNIWAGSSDTYSTLSRSKLKDLLTRQLNYSYPSEYNFSMPIDCNYDDWAYINMSNLVRKFLSPSTNNFKNGHIRMGLIVEGNTNSEYQCMKNGSLYQSMYQQIRVIKNLTPSLLILIKAKYIPKFRAMLYLQLGGMDFPLDSMKVLQSTVGLLSNSIYASNEFIRFLDRQKPIVEQVTKQDLLKYLIPTDLTSLINKSQQDVLKCALQYIEEEEKELEVV